jgi:dihydropteroate synthase
VREGDQIVARLLSADSAAALVQRLAPYLDEATLRRAVDRAEHLPLVVDRPPRAAFELAALLETHGGFAHATAEHLVVVAPRSVLVAIYDATSGDVQAVAAALLRAHDASRTRTRSLRLRDQILDVGRAPAVMGILNVTPDSFYDRGRYSALDDARARAAAMVEQGVALLDIGGQSYAAGNPTIETKEERRRVEPVVRALIADGIGVPLSIDTCKAEVAEASLDAGAHLINDCSGLSDRNLPKVVARYDAALVVMHLKGRLNVREEAYPYEDAMAEIIAFLHERCERVRSEGVDPASIIVDPGLEFGKEPQTDLDILDRFGDLRALGFPILFAASRKSFIGRIFHQPSSELLVPSLATAAVGIAAGAAVVRVHDVAETVALARMMAALRPENRQSLSIAPLPPKDPLPIP